MKILITAGPTREAIDPIRFISNRSSGKMGYALANTAIELEHEVVLISGPVFLPAPPVMKLIRVESAAEMATAVHRYASEAEVIIMAAAVADYRPVDPLKQKLKKGEGKLVLELEQTEDILASLGGKKPDNQLLVGFAAETEDLLQNAQKKLTAKNLDWIIANDVSKSDRGIAADQNAVTLISRAGQIVELPLTDKNTLAKQIFEVILG